MRRPTMRFVPVKSAERQAVLVLHRSRELLVRQRTMLINAIRAHCAEFGLIAAQGARGARDLVERTVQANNSTLPEVARGVVMLLAEQLEALVAQIQALNRRFWSGIGRARKASDWQRSPASASSAPRHWLHR